MPKIVPTVLNAVFYLYESRADAEAGRSPGGTRFIVGWNKGPSLGGPYHIYAVTNWHVAVKDDDPDDPPCPVIRMNTKSNKTEISRAKAERLALRAGRPRYCGDAIGNRLATLNWSYVPTDMFALIEDVQSGKVAVGDDVFMAGLFVDHDGGAVNVPSARLRNSLVLLPSPICQHSSGDRAEGSSLCGGYALAIRIFRFSSLYLPYARSGFDETDRDAIPNRN